MDVSPLTLLFVAGCAEQLNNNKATAETQLEAPTSQMWRWMAETSTEYIKIDIFIYQGTRMPIEVIGTRSVSLTSAIRNKGDSYVHGRYE